MFSCLKCFSPLTFGVVWDYYWIKTEGQTTWTEHRTKKLQTEIKILTNPGLALSGFEQPGPGLWIAGNNVFESFIPKHFFESCTKYPNPTPLQTSALRTHKLLASSAFRKKDCSFLFFIFCRMLQNSPLFFWDISTMHSLI